MYLYYIHEKFKQATDIHLSNVGSFFSRLSICCASLLNSWEFNGISPSEWASGYVIWDTCNWDTCIAYLCLSQYSQLSSDQCHCDVILPNAVMILRSLLVLPYFPSECTPKGSAGLCLCHTLQAVPLCVGKTTSNYRGADKSLAWPGRKQTTVTENFEFHISCL